MPARDTKEDATGRGAGGRGGAGAWGKGGGSKSAPFHQHLFPLSSLRGASPARPGQDDGVVSQELRVEGTMCLVRGGVLNA